MANVHLILKEESLSPTLWTHSYFYDTTGKVTTAKITEYINDPHHS
ncbi:transposase [Coleofasciculus sp. E1-EBD-02]